MDGVVIDMVEVLQDILTDHELCLKQKEELEKAIHMLRRLKADCCEGCAYIKNEEWEMPCCKCKRASKDYWRPKERE